LTRSIENTADGAREIRATGSTSAGEELAGRSGARSFLTALFGVHDEGAPFLLQASGEGFMAVKLDWLDIPTNQETPVLSYTDPGHPLRAV
jgi:hypothetical protein